MLFEAVGQAEVEHNRFEAAKALSVLGAAAGWEPSWVQLLVDGLISCWELNPAAGEGCAQLLYPVRSAVSAGSELRYAGASRDERHYVFRSVPQVDSARVAHLRGGLRDFTVPTQAGVVQPLMPLSCTMPVTGQLCDGRS